ncbi:MAG: hypothetical protein NTY38_31395 [Acidobacteria bacterium]|nr:hypothetical protein [Acidobacteriota bacterium]
MTAIASRPQVVEIEPQVRPLLNGYLMVGVEVAFTPIVSVAKLGENTSCGWVTETVPAEVSHDSRLPTAIHASPAVTPEAEDPQSAMVRIVSAVTAGAAAFVVFTLARAAVLFAGSAGS